MLRLLLITVFALSHIPDGRSAVPEEYYASIRRLEECPGVDLPVKIHKMYMNYRGNSQYTLTLNMTTHSDAERPLSLKFEVIKCASEHGPCEDFVNHTIDNVCDELQTEGSIPRDFFKIAKLPLRCPIPKGDYFVDRSEIKVPQELLDLGRYGNYWQLKVYLLHAERLVFCMYCEGKVAKFTKLKKKKKKNE